LPDDGTPAEGPGQASLHDLIDSLRAYVEYQRSTGAQWFPLEEAPPAPGVGARPPGGGSRPVPPAPDGEPTPVRAATTTDDLFRSHGLRHAATLAELRAEIGDCRRCKLCSGRTHLVFGVGNPHAQLMFVGEGPGRDEDLKGEPFVGRAGQLLTEIITKGMKLRREDVYIANVIKCRPPENRNPEPDEIAACQPFLQRQIDIVHPHVLVALGTFAAQTLLGVRTPISRLRGHWHDYRGTKLMPTLHPAYLLRNPADKKLVWADIRMVMAELEKAP
jgi:uracil-DNA glycosylase family 4